MFQRLASSRLMDPAPARIQALERRIIQAIKRGELTAARKLLVRRLALCGPADPRRAGVEKVARVVEDGIARGLDGVPQSSYTAAGA